MSGSTRKLGRQRAAAVLVVVTSTHRARRWWSRFWSKPRDYLQTQQESKILARKSALSYKAQENSIALILEDFSFEAQKLKSS